MEITIKQLSEIHCDEYVYVDVRDKYNPDELVNSDLKRSVGKRASSKSKEELERNVRSHLKSLQLNPSKIGSFFYAPHTIYAA